MKISQRVIRSLCLLSLWLGLGLQAHAQTDTVTYVYTDPQGTPLAEADAQGNVIARYDYTPYGNAVASLGSAPNGPGYTGHVNDPETGLVYMQARYYDPATGRFLSVDPEAPAAGNAFNFNRYDYASNNPIVNIDPDGRQAQTAATELGRELHALWISKGDSKKYNAIMANYREQDRENLKVALGLTDIGIVADAAEITVRAAKGDDATAQGEGAITGEIAEEIAKKFLAKKIGEPAAGAVAAVAGQIAGDIAETAAGTSQNKNSSQQPKNTVERKEHPSNEPSNTPQEAPYRRPPPPPIEDYSH